MDRVQLVLANNEVELPTHGKTFWGYLTRFQVFVNVLILATSCLRVSYEEFIADLTPMMQVLATNYPDLA